MKRSLLALDYRLQLFFFILIASTFYLIFPLMLLVPFGAYQVISATTKGFTLNSYKHRVFALAAGTYGVAIMLLLQNGYWGPIEEIRDLLPEGVENFMIFLLYLVIPIVSAIFYIRWSHQDLQDAIEEELEAARVKEYV